MAAEEDKKFDAVLGGFLVNDLRVPSGHIHCPEPEVLAAYHERSLLPEEMNSWKEHIVGCARCQAILSELEASDSIPLQISAKEEVLVGKEAEPLDVAGRGATAVPARVPAKSPITTISRRVRWQWVVPAGALAAGLLVWIAWHENQPLQMKAPGEVKMARVEPPATSAPQTSATRDDRQLVSSDEIAELSKDQGAIGEAPAKVMPKAKSLKKFEEHDSRGRVAGPEPQADKETVARADAALESLSAANRAQNQPAQDAKAGPAGAASETVEVQTLTANPQLQNQQKQNLQNQRNEQKVPGPSPLGQAAQTAKAKPESARRAYRALSSPAKPAAAPPPAASDSIVSSNLIAGAFDLNLIVAPGKKTLWRVGRSGLIDFSSDGGASWSRQTSNVTLDLTSGSAPSDRVCWIVGRAGTIFLTTDAGLHWTILHSPLGEDLGGVRATDALHATIWNLGSTKVFETFDGGVTWKPVASQ